MNIKTLLIATLCLVGQRPAGDILKDVGTLIDEYRHAPVVVGTSGELTAALKLGGVINLTPGTVYTGPFASTVPGTRILGAEGSWVAGVGGPAILVTVGGSDFEAHNLIATATGTDWAVIRLGENDNTQTTLAQEPSGVVLTNIRIPTFRGKRGIEVNARHVAIVNTEILDVWHPNASDSQAVGILNSSGDIQILGGHFQAGSEVIMVGGDTIKLVGIQTRNILIEDALLDRPLSWQTDGINRGVKNVLEFKGGIDVTVRRTRLSGCWIAAQTGVGLTITARDKRVVDNLTFEDVTIDHVASGVQMVGRDYVSFTDGALHVTFVRLKVLTDKKAFGNLATGASGRGLVAEISAEPALVSFVDGTYLNDGDSMILSFVGQVMNEDGTKRNGGPIGELTFSNNKSKRGVNGMFLNGFANGGVNGEGKACCTVVTVEGNTFAGDSSSSVMKKNFPLNTYVVAATAAEWVW